MKDPYTIRRYEPADRKGYLSLYETVYRPETTEWFEWRYAANPYLSHVPIFVAEAAGEIAGAVAFLPFPIRVGGLSALALQPADAMVHPDHRRQGLFTRMLRAAIDYYAEGEPSLFFNFPTEGAKPGLTNLGWSALELATTYRVQNPAAFVRPRRGHAALGAVATPFARGYLGLCDRLAARSARLAVERYSGVPASALAALYERDVPEEIHVPRKERFYEWRFADPNWDPTTYVATRDGTPVAGAITCPLGLHGRAIVKVMDVLATPDCERRRAIGSVLAAVAADNSEADVIAAPTATLPESAASAHGFRPDDGPPLSWMTTPTTMAVRPLVLEAEGAWRLGDRRLDDASDWHVSFCDEDTPLYG